MRLLPLNRVFRKNEIHDDRLNKTKILDIPIFSINLFSTNKLDKQFDLFSGKSKKIKKFEEKNALSVRANF